jgi:hypothetical protein
MLEGRRDILIVAPYNAQVADLFGTAAEDADWDGRQSFRVKRRRW